MESSPYSNLGPNSTNKITRKVETDCSEACKLANEVKLTR